MKTLFMTAVISLAASSAFAGTLSCQQPDTNPDYGYAVTFSKDLSKARVYQKTIAGPRLLSELACEKRQGPPAPCCDRISVAMTCHETQIVDGGFSLTVRTGGFAGLTTAELNGVTIAGPKPLARLICR